MEEIQRYFISEIQTLTAGMPAVMPAHRLARRCQAPLPAHLPAVTPTCHVIQHSHSWFGCDTSQPEHPKLKKHTIEINENTKETKLPLVQQTPELPLIHRSFHCRPSGPSCPTYHEILNHSSQASSLHSKFLPLIRPGPLNSQGSWRHLSLFPSTNQRESTPSIHEESTSSGLVH